MRVCIVDAHSSGSLYAPEFRRRGVESVHVQSYDPMNPVDQLTFVRDDHVANLVFDGNFEKLLGEVAAFRPLCVIPGAESGVPIADRLSEALGLLTNGTAKSPARRQKDAMQRELERAGVRFIPTHRAHTWSDAEQHIAKLEMPVVLKPPAAAGTDHVFICNTLEQARAAFDSILGEINTYLVRNDGALVQPCIDGEEFAVDTVSCAGHHMVTDIWHVRKVRGARPLYDTSTVVSSTDARGKQLSAYAFQVLDALHIKHGPAHIEMMVDRRGPVLIEVGARLVGTKPHPWLAKSFGFSQLDVSVDAYLDPARFFRRVAEPYAVPPHLCRVWLLASKTGTVRALPRLEDVQRLTSWTHTRMFVGVGDKLSLTTDLDTLPGWIDLTHDDLEVIQRDYQQIRAWEADDFYVVD